MLAVLAIVPLSLSGQLARADEAAIVRAPAGALRGEESAGVRRFLGIPFAKPPLGELRWRSPQPLPRWRETRDARHFGANCYQSTAEPFGPWSAEFLISKDVSEDCLTLNVWAPARGAKALPLYVFIHGGAFQGGSGSIPIYDGSALAAHGVVVVTLNYRLGVFGYLAHPALTRESALHSSGNYGLEDVIAALRWLHANAAAFGGDPKRISIAGQSAGAATVNDLIVSPQARGLFAGAVSESGPGMGVHPPSLATAEGYGVELMQAAGVADLAALRALPAAELQRLAGVPLPSDNKVSDRPMFRFAPNIDGVVVGADPDAGAAPLTPVPMLGGYAADEARPWGPLERTPEAFAAEVQQRYGDFAERLLALYPHATVEEATASSLLLGRDRYMASLVIDAERREAHGQKLYGYIFDHAYPIPGMAHFHAFHTADVPYVFGALKQVDRQFTTQDRAVSEQLQARWVPFLQSGSPAGEGLADWPRAGDGRALVMAFGDAPGVRPAVSSPERLELLREYVAAGHFLSLF